MNKKSKHAPKAFELEHQRPPKDPSRPLGPRSKDHGIAPELRRKGEWNPRRDRSG